MKGECSDAASKWYCNTLFYEAFPKALNLGRSGWTIENWITAIKGGDPVITKLAEMAYHDQIIIELGANNIPNSKQDASDILASMLELISLLRTTFPHCKLKLLSILPRDYPRQYRELKEKTVAANKALQLYFRKHADEAEFADVTSYFFAKDKREPNIQMYMPDHLHLSCNKGFAAFETAIKRSFPSLGK